MSEKKENGNRGENIIYAKEIKINNAEEIVLYEK